MVFSINGPRTDPGYDPGHCGRRPACRYRQVYRALHGYLRLQAGDCEKNGHKKEKSVVCYFTNWALYRSDKAMFTPENIDTSLCTHIIYAFAVMDNVSFTIVPSDTWSDLDKEFYQKVTALKSPTTKVSLAVGGWTDSGSDKYSRMMRNKTARAVFVTSVVNYLDQYGFDGLDVDHEYPGCPQGNNSAGLPSDKDDFNTLMSELKAAFKPSGKQLTVAVAAGKRLVDECFNMAELCQIVDELNVMAYDYHGTQDGETGANSPYSGTQDTWGTVESIEYFINDLKCPAAKLMLGVPFYAKSFTLEEGYPGVFGVPISGPGDAGPYTKSAGTLAYYETCEFIKNGWLSGYNDVNGSYATNGTQFVSLTTRLDMSRKSQLVHKYNLGGAMCWALDHDDFNDICGCGSYPLLKTLNDLLRPGHVTPQMCY